MARMTKRESNPKKLNIFKKKNKRPCFICANKIAFVDYKDTSLLKRFQNERGKIVSAKQTFLCAKHQREMTVAIKRARNIGLLPISSSL